MHGEMIGAGVFKFLRKIAGFEDHQVNIARLFCGFPEELNDHGSETDIGNETSIHHIEVKPIGFTFVEHFAFGFHVEEVGS